MTSTFRSFSKFTSVYFLVSPSVTLSTPSMCTISLACPQDEYFTEIRLHSATQLSYSKTCVEGPLSKRSKIGFQGQLSLNAGQKYCRMLQYFWLSSSYHLSLRALLCLVLSGHFTQVLLYTINVLKFSNTFLLNFCSQIKFWLSGNVCQNSKQGRFWSGSAQFVLAFLQATSGYFRMLTIIFFLCVCWFFTSLSTIF